MHLLKTEDARGSERCIFLINPNSDVFWRYECDLLVSFLRTLLYRHLYPPSLIFHLTPTIVLFHDGAREVCMCAKLCLKIVFVAVFCGSSGDGPYVTSGASVSGHFTHSAIIATVRLPANPNRMEIQNWRVSYKKQDKEDFTHVLVPVSNRSTTVNLPSNGLWDFMVVGTGPTGNEKSSVPQIGLTLGRKHSPQTFLASFFVKLKEPSDE